MTPERERELIEAVTYAVCRAANRLYHRSSDPGSFSDLARRDAIIAINTLRAMGALEDNEPKGQDHEV